MDLVRRGWLAALIIDVAVSLGQGGTAIALRTGTAIDPRAGRREQRS